jgi:hypothetical protein
MILIGGIWFLIAAFRESIWWGLACLFFPIVQFFFLFAHWQSAKRPFGLQLLGIIFVVAGFLLAQFPVGSHH